jgi:hypothetical protein
MIVLAHLEDRSIERADLVSFDGSGADFTAHSPGGVTQVRILWHRPITERPEVREQPFALLNDAVDKLETRRQ